MKHCLSGLLKVDTCYNPHNFTELETCCCMLIGQKCILLHTLKTALVNTFAKQSELEDRANNSVMMEKAADSHCISESSPGTG